MKEKIEELIKEYEQEIQYLNRHKNNNVRNFQPIINTYELVIDDLKKLLI